MLTRRNQFQRSALRNKKRITKPLWKSYLSTMLAGLLMGLILAAGIWLWQKMKDPQTLPFREIRVYGQFKHLQAEQIRQELWPQIHQGFFALKLEIPRKFLMTNPWIQDVAIRRLPGILLITVREHVPVVRWNQNYLINSDVQLFLTPPNFNEELPILEGPDDASHLLVFSYYNQINALLKPLQLTVRKLTLDSRGNWELTLSNGIAVTLGNDNVLGRVQRFSYWYPKMINDRVNDVTHIDMRYSNSIAVEYRDHI